MLRHLETTLIAQGLFPREAHAMVETWRDTWFEEGARLIYLVPSPAIDTILPLQVEPAPSKTVRVFVGRIELITPTTVRSLQSAIAANKWSEVSPYSRFLDPILTRIYPGNAPKISEIKQSYRNSQASLTAEACR